MRAALAGLAIDVSSLAELGSRVVLPEAGRTYAENAAAKARVAAETTRLAALADDSGLEVDDLGGEPGVHTARYFGADLSDAEKVARLLARLEGLPPERRAARFRCLIALAWPRGEGGGEAAAPGRVELFEGVCEGVLATEARGAGGFGFDPVFIPAGESLTFAQLPPERKAAISHRARALAKVRAFLAGRPAGDRPPGQGKSAAGTA
ncbi:MAG: non-canonical purine NTP pyrophosphatase [Candidatus Tectomicrobia bacterium]|nr:non-canonical purine NTP pyrophosphatase [Candidatus Tectomicrobia bacterium]